MSEHVNIPDVGAPDPELNNSPIADPGSDDYEVLKQEIPGEPVCYFNNASYENNALVCSGSSLLLKCNYGIWVVEGTCDPDNQ